ncbi:glycerol-3-phosphate acyltransferase PlsX [Micromonospora purpureochromogenes]|uniref:Phosphate acyltransferase n=1 Tax=Micromonospora purpureochromogenes TaxID=47872 RepID=A0ABX2RM81_9ACTN|nr:glycerol-3-phosphate acyltransferase PlsX [Micromonospora purpureochromogenes]
MVDGALRAVRADPDLHLLLVGPTEVAAAVTDALTPAQRARTTVRPVRAAAGPAHHEPRADSTVRAAVAAIRDGAADALVSAGSTGATVSAAALGFGRWADVRRPALVATLPAVAGPVVLLDVGGSLEPRPLTLARHAVLGAAYAAVAHAVDRPRVGLLSVGTEAGKGDRPRKAADALLTAASLPCGARYVGLVEGYDVALGARADVVVTDGFTGNVLLKAIEGAYAMAGGPPAGGGAPRAAALLGVAGTVVVCHGAAGAEDVASGIALAAHLWRRGASDRVRELLDGAAVGPSAVDRTDEARP